MCGKPKCCPDVTTDASGDVVTLKENGTTIKLTFEQVGKIYKDMCVKKQLKCDCGKGCCHD